MFRISRVAALLAAAAFPALPGIIEHSAGVLPNRPFEWTVTDVSTPGKVEYLLEAALDFNVFAGSPAEPSTISGSILQPVEVVCAPGTQFGTVTGSTNIEVGSLGGGAVQITGLLTGGAFAGNGESFVRDYADTVPVAPQDPLLLKNAAGDIFPCSEPLADNLLSLFEAAFVNAGPDPARLRMNVSHRATLTGVNEIPEPGYAALVILAAGFIAIAQRRRSAGPLMSPRSPNPIRPSRIAPPA